MADTDRELDRTRIQVLLQELDKRLKGEDERATLYISGAARNAVVHPEAPPAASIQASWTSGAWIGREIAQEIGEDGPYRPGPGWINENQPIAGKRLYFGADPAAETIYESANLKVTRSSPEREFAAIVNSPTPDRGAAELVATELDIRSVTDAQTAYRWIKADETADLPTAAITAIKTFMPEIRRSDRVWQPPARSIDIAAGETTRRAALERLEVETPDLFETGPDNIPEHEHETIDEIDWALSVDRPFDDEPEALSPEDVRLEMEGPAVPLEAYSHCRTPEETAEAMLTWLQSNTDPATDDELTLRIETEWLEETANAVDRSNRYTGGVDPVRAAGDEPGGGRPKKPARTGDRDR